MGVKIGLRIYKFKQYLGSFYFLLMLVLPLNSSSHAMGVGGGGWGCDYSASFTTSVFILRYLSLSIQNFLSFESEELSGIKSCIQILRIWIWIDSIEVYIKHTKIPKGPRKRKRHINYPHQPKTKHNHKLIQ